MILFQSIKYSISLAEMEHQGHKGYGGGQIRNKVCLKTVKRLSVLTKLQSLSKDRSWSFNIAMIVSF